MGPSEIEASMAPTQKVDAPELMASSVESTYIVIAKLTAVIQC